MAFAAAKAIPPGGTIKCGCSSSGRAPPCQGGGSEFEPRQPLQKIKHRLSVDAFSFIRRIIFFYAEAHFFYAQAQINVFAFCISDAEGEDMPHRERFLAAFGGPGVSVPTDRGIAAVWRRRKKGTGHHMVSCPLLTPLTFLCAATPFGRAAKCEGPTETSGAPRVHP